MLTIYKYPINNNVPGKTVLELPRGAQIRHIGRDPEGEVCVWAEVENNATEVEKHVVIIVGTGWNLRMRIDVEAHTYFNTFLDGPFVWHTYIGMEQE